MPPAAMCTTSSVLAARDGRLCTPGLPTPRSRYAALARESRYRRPDTTMAPRPSHVAASQKSHPT